MPLWFFLCCFGTQKVSFLFTIEVMVKKICHCNCRVLTHITHAIFCQTWIYTLWAQNLLASLACEIGFHTWRLIFWTQRFETQGLLCESWQFAWLHPLSLQTAFSFLLPLTTLYSFCSSFFFQHLTETLVYPDPPFTQTKNNFHSLVNSQLISNLLSQYKVIDRGLRGLSI